MLYLMDMDWGFLFIFNCTVLHKDVWRMYEYVNRGVWVWYLQRSLEANTCMQEPVSNQNSGFGASVLLIYL